MSKECLKEYEGRLKDLPPPGKALAPPPGKSLAPPPPEAPLTVPLPPGVYWYAHKGTYRVKLQRAGQLYPGPSSMDLNALHEWRRAKEAELDAQNVPATRVHAKATPASRQSATPGVTWHERAQRWRGKCVDRLVSAEAGTTRYRCTPYSTDEADCVAAFAALRAAEAKAFEAEMAKRQAADPRLAGLDRAPAFADAQPGTVYCHVDKKTKYVPFRAVAGAKFYHRACAECAQRAQANAPGGVATHCKQHGGGPRCPGPREGGECPYGVAVHLGKGDIYDGRCVACFCAAFPNDARAAAARSSVHAKERKVTDELKKCFPDYNWVFDQTFAHRTFVVGTRHRPDARFKHHDRVVIVEVDEHSHRSYLCAKEREREQSFVVQNRGKTVVMIRFNPDAYTDYAGKRIPSCFTAATKDNQIVHVPDKQKAQWKRRLAELTRTIATLADPDFELPPKQEDRPLLVCELFYDDVNGTPEDERVAATVEAYKTARKRKRQRDEHVKPIKPVQRPVFDDSSDSE